MGEVYRARDTKLDRDVALKILPESFAGDADRRMRFEREAKTLASLNHPNIAAIDGIEDRALVMELVEGDDLSQRIARGPIPIDEALPIAKQIADAQTVTDGDHLAGTSATTGGRLSWIIAGTMVLVAAVAIGRPWLSGTLDVAAPPDGRRFLVSASIGEAPTPPLSIIVNSAALRPEREWTGLALIRE